MRILIIEDEARIAKRLERMTRQFFEHNLKALTICDSLAKGLSHIEQHPIDVLLLDLNLNGEDGFKVLEPVVAGSFHTIIVSANTDRAITAFAYGVLDFVAKPFDEIRLAQAFKRITVKDDQKNHHIQFLAIKKGGEVHLIDVAEISYIQGAGIYSELHLNNGKTALHDKSLEKLEQLLAGTFERIHKSYLVPLDTAEKIMVQAGGKYSLLLYNGTLLPIGRARYKELKRKMI